MIDPKSLEDTRLQLHWAAQAAAGFGRTLLPKRPDFSQESFRWSGTLSALLQDLVEAPRPFRSAIRLRDLTLLLLDGADSIIAQLDLEGHTLADGFAFFEEQAAAQLGKPVALERSPEGIPPHPVATGARFHVADRAQLEELAGYFGEAAVVLEQVSAREEGAGPVRCWPHHFDVATLITLSGEGENAHTIGVGMSPGDSSYGEPYYYVTPWPYPAAESLRPLCRGEWHTAGWVGAVLRAGGSDHESALAFLTEAIGVLR